MPSNVETAFPGLYDRPSGRVRVAPPRKYKIGAKEEEDGRSGEGPTTRRRLGWLLLALVTLALAVAAASCGGDDEEAAAPPPAEPAEPAEPPAEPPADTGEPAETGAAPAEAPATGECPAEDGVINVFSASDLESATLGQNISPGAFVRMTDSTSTR